MNALEIEGGIPLFGKIQISGSKNTSLPILSASLLLNGKTNLCNIPNIGDVQTLKSIIRKTGASCEDLSPGCVQIDPSGINNYSLCDTAGMLRGSIWLTIPILRKLGKVKFPKPGGCKIGLRPIDLHLKAFSLMGAEIDEEEGYYTIKMKGSSLRGSEIFFDKVTVGGTQNALLAAIVAKGGTIIRNASREPEVSYLGQFLQKCGAKIEGLGTETIYVHECGELNSIEYTMPPDRIECGSYAMAALATKGECELLGVRKDHLLDTIPILAMMNAEPTETEAGLLFKYKGPLLPVDIETGPHPNFPTDLQAPITALLCFANGVSRVTENIFENRFKHVPFLNSMGARIEINQKQATINPVSHLNGANVMATDLRSSKALIIAALAANGKTVITEIKHVKRGYQDITRKLAGVGARIGEVSIA